jgi:hypothetical protein
MAPAIFYHRRLPIIAAYLGGFICIRCLFTHESSAMFLSEKCDPGQALKALGT